ncbi:MAG: hypothetical protein JWQ09_3244 [Segetibacter sp.]|nr:hypothetical protein [Segetibacter sp.]
MKLLIAVSLFITFIFACSAAKRATPSAIGVVTLHNYLLNPDVSFNDDIHYTFIGDANEFHKMFYMTKVSPGTAIVPDFESQSVVAIILKLTEKVMSVDINKAAITGNELKIYYTITDTTSWKTYSQTPMVIATVPKNTSVKRVSFYSHDIKEKTITANY